MIQRILNWFWEDRTFGAVRNPKWPSFRRIYLKSSCEICGKKWFLELHHILPFNLFPQLELRPENTVTLCRRHHFELAHFFNFKKYNPEIKNWIKKIKL